MFLVTWVSNLIGAAGVYFVARRYGRRLFASPTGRRLLAPRSLAIIEREYLRFGIVGIFISRFLPGIRAVVPPFAGLVGLGAVRTLAPMGLASAIWYGGLTILGALIGSEWERISALIASVNRTLFIATLVLAAAGGIWYLLRRRQRGARAGLARHPGRARSGRALVSGRHRHRRRLGPAGRGARGAGARVRRSGAHARRPATHRRASARPLGSGAGGTPPSPAPEEERRTRFADYARRLRKRVGRPERLELVERMWTVAFADGAIGAHEARLMHLAAELLGLKPAELADVSRRLQAQRDR